MTTPVKRMAFEDLLVEKGLILEREKDALVETAHTTNQTIAAILLERGTLTDDMIGQVLADQYGLPWNASEGIPHSVPSHGIHPGRTDASL